MGFRDRLIENLYKLRIIPNTTSADVTTFAKEGQTLPDKVESAIENGQRIDLSDISKITNLKVNRNEKYTIFEDMVTDGRIGAGVEMYANDTVQPNQEGRILWVESEDPDVVKYVENLLSDLNIEQNMWTYAYRMYLYGDVYLETFKSSSNDNSKPNLLLAKVNGNASNVTIQKPLIGQNIERYIELVPNPANIYDLQYKGKTSGYARGDDDLSVVNSDLNMSGTFFYSNENHTIDLLGPTKFVHICLSPNINRFPEKFKLIKDDKKNNIWNNDNLIDGSEKEGNTNGALTFNVKSGQSILENVYAPYQTLKLKEDSILLERITKSSITRIVQIELGDMPENQKRLKLQELKNQIEQQMILNKDNGTVQSRPGGQPIENIVYTTTNNGKGVISSVNIGGDVDIGNTDDIESSENKVYGSLLIPKGLLGANMEGCLSGDTKLWLLNGEEISIKELVDNIENYKGKGIMSCNEDGTLVPTKIVNGKLTRENALLVRVHLDNDTFIDCTPDHLFMMRDGTFKEAQDLQSMDSLMPYYESVKNNRRYVLDNKTGIIIPQYRLVAQTKYGKLDKPDHQVHHEDRNKFNDDFDNLSYISTKKHLDEHRKEAQQANKIAWQNKKANMSEEEYEEYLNKYKEFALKGQEIQKYKRENLPEWKEHEHNAKSKARKQWMKEHPEWLTECSFASPNNPMFNEELKAKCIKNMQKAMINKVNTDAEYKQILTDRILKGQKISVQKRKEKAAQLKRNCRCFKCGKIFKKRLTDDEYIDYLNKDKLVVCCQECNYSTPCMTKVSNSLKLFKQSNYDLEKYIYNKYNGEFGRPDKYSNPETLNLILNMYNNYEPKVENHKVAYVEWLDHTEDTYDIEVENSSHTFVLSNGIFVHNSGLSNGGSLTEMNTTYARRIKRGQQALISGFTDLVNIFALAEGVGDKVVNNYTIRITPIITIEDIRRDELLGTKINNVRDILNLFDNVEDTVDDQTKLELLLNWLGSYLSQSDAVDIINNTKEETTSDKDTLDDTKSDDKENKSKPSRVDVRHHISSDSMKDEEIPIITRKPNLETPEQVNLNDIEGEDLL